MLRTRIILYILYTVAIKVYPCKLGPNLQVEMFIRITCILKFNDVNRNVTIPCNDNRELVEHL